MDTTKTNVTMKATRTSVRRTTAPHKQQLERHAQQAAHIAQQVHQWRCWLLRLRGAHRALSLHIERTVPHLMMTPHTSRLMFWAIKLSSTCHTWRVLFDSISPFFLYWSFLSFSVVFLYPELYFDLDNPIVMASLRFSTADESEDTLNSFTSHTGYKPNLLTFGELNDSSVSISFMIPSTDQDVDDVTLGEMLTAAHRRQVEYCVPGGMPVSQSSSSIMFDGSGQLDVERMVDHSRKSGVTFNMISAHSKFLKTPELRMWSMDQGNLMSETARTHRIGLCLKSKDRRPPRNTAKKSVITNSMQLEQNKNAKFYKKNYGDRNWNFVKVINRVLQKWKNYENFRVLLSIRLRDEN